MHEPKKTPLSLPPKQTKETLSVLQESPKAKTWRIVQTVLTLLLSSFLVAFSAYCLIEPNEFTVGGIGGIAIMIAYATNGAVPQSILVFAFNLPLVVLSFFFVKRKFAVLTTSHIVLQSIWLTLLEQLHAPEIAFAENMRLFAAIAAALCLGVAISLALKIGGSTGGADILAVLIQKKFPAQSIAWMLFFVNATIIGSSFFVFYDTEQTIALNLLPIMLALFEAYIESKTNDSITNGFQSAIEFRIITDKPEEMSLALMNELNRGVTSLPATGMYTKEPHTMLVCVISRRQVGALRRVMRTVDPNAFAVMSGVSQVLGLGFYHEEQ